MKRIGIFADVSNLYYCIGMKYPERKLDYAAYMKYVQELGELTIAYAYGAQLENEASGFIHCLKATGYTPKYKTPKTYKSEGKIKRKADWDVGIAMDIVQTIDRLDIVVLGSADGDLCPAVDWAQRHGATVVILACGISRDLRDLADQAIEIPESLLENKYVNPIRSEPSDSGKRPEPTKLPIRGCDQPIPDGFTLQQSTGAGP
jgi:uncharacterized LabA/DUF88 family protein